MITAKVPQLIYGGDFHPEAWPEALWAEDVTLMRRAGVNLRDDRRLFGDLASRTLTPTLLSGWIACSICFTKMES